MSYVFFENDKEKSFLQVSFLLYENRLTNETILISNKSWYTMS